MDDAFMFRRRTQNVYSNDYIAPKHSNTSSMASLKNGRIPAAHNSFEDLEALKKIIKPERRHLFSENDFEVYNANGANGRSQFM